MFIVACCSLCRSEKKCCLCIKVRNAVAPMTAFDILEALLNLTLIYLYAKKHDSLTFVPWALILFGNLIPVSLRLVGAVFSCLGSFRLWTRQAYYCMRLWALLFMFIVLALQGFMSYYVLQDSVGGVGEIPLVGKYLEESESTGVDSNYDKLSYGLCVFCDP